MSGNSSRFGSRVTSTVAASLIVAAMVSQVHAAGASIGAASIKLKPSSGPPTTRTKVIGSSFGVTEQVVITFDAKQVGTTTTDEAGHFSKSVKVPRSAKPGDHTVTATGQSSGLMASKTFLV